MASAVVGSPRWSCHFVVGSWLVISVEPALITIGVPVKSRSKSHGRRTNLGSDRGAARSPRR